MFNFNTEPILGGGFEGPAVVATKRKGTASVPFKAVAERFAESLPRTDHYQCITFQPAYQMKSLEELRVEDYAQGLRYDISELEEDLPGNQETGSESRVDSAKARVRADPTVEDLVAFFLAPRKSVNMFQQHAPDESEKRLEEQMKQAKARVEQIEAELTQARIKRMADLEKENSILEVEKGGLMFKNIKAELKAEELEEKCKHAQEKLVALGEEVESQKKTISELERRNVELQSREKDLKELVEKFQADVEVSKVRLGRLLSIESRLGQIRRRISSSKDVSTEDADFEMMRNLFGEL